MLPKLAAFSSLFIYNKNYFLEIRDTAQQNKAEYEQVMETEYTELSKSIKNAKVFLSF